MHRLAILCLAIGALVALDGQARASGVFPGSQCQSASNHDNYQLNFSRAQNASSTATLVVDCPVPHHQTGGTIGAGITVRDLHATADIRCSFFGIKGNVAGNFGFVQTGFSAGSSTTPQSINFSSIPVDLTFHYFIGCQVPPQTTAGRSELINYGSVTFN